MGGEGGNPSESWQIKRPLNLSWVNLWHETHLGQSERGGGGVRVASWECRHVMEVALGDQVQGQRQDQGTHTTAEGRAPAWLPAWLPVLTGLVIFN